MKWRLFPDPEIPGSAGDRAIGSRRGDRRFRFWFCMVIFAGFLGPLQGCSTPIRLAAVPKEQQAAAVVGGMSGIRYWQKEDLARMQQDARDAYFREAELFAAAGNKGTLPPANFLAISGGGEDGAFGAGLLVGWTAAGTRPEFKLVTGISTGALTAPFAFLGPAYDQQLKAVYTTIAAKDILSATDNKRAKSRHTKVVRTCIELQKCRPATTSRESENTQDLQVLQARKPLQVAPPIGTVQRLRVRRGPVAQELPK